MRIQLAIPNNHFVSPQVFNQLFTMHGTTMVFFVGMPHRLRVRELPGAADDRRARHGVPAAECLQLLDERVRRAAFCTSASSAASGLYGAGSAPDVGWFAYAPLTSPAFSPGHSTDYWIIGLLVSGIGSIGTALNIVDHDLLHALPGHDAGPDAAVRLAEPGHGVPGPDRRLAR